MNVDVLDLTWFGCTSNGDGIFHLFTPLFKIKTRKTTTLASPFPPKQILESSALLEDEYKRDCHAWIRCPG